jgi:act minimal PKS acyl carrier protein
MSVSHQFTLADLKRILVERVGLTEADVPDDLETAFVEVGLDSLAVVEIQAAVQQIYGFAIADEDASAMMTFGETIDYVNGRLSMSEAA